MSWDQQNYLVIRGFCYIRPLYNEVPLYMFLSICVIFFQSLKQGPVSYSLLKSNGRDVRLRPYVADYN